MSKKNVVIGFMGTQLDSGQERALEQVAAHGVSDPA